MSPIQILGLEVRGFLLLLAAMLAYRMLTRQIPLNNLLSSSLTPGQVNPERVQLLVATLMMSAHYLNEVAHTTGNALPDVSATWLTVFGGSSGVYAVMKGFSMWRLKTQNVSGDGD